tara:strand:- start:267 stop:1268 length:1002 start_codon:yes stop_codon:yes gene_type:complete
VKKTLIFGGGAIGSFLAYCLYSSNHKIYFLCRNEHYKMCKKNGLKIKVYKNHKLINNSTIKKNKNFVIINDIKKIKKDIKFDYIFITTKINENIKKIYYKIEKYIDKNTAIIPPCTSIPFWWYKSLKKEKQEIFEKRLDKIFMKNIKRRNIIGMTMWLSGKVEKPGVARIGHIQRGLPIKEVFSEFKMKADSLRKDIKKKCKSPFIKDIYSEIFIKSINALAFNLIALDTKKNNLELSKDFVAKKRIFQILREGDNILLKNKIKIFQSASSRIKQTLSSKLHTMSMLNSYNNKKPIEIVALWKSFDNLIYNLKMKMPFTKKIFISVRKKIVRN